jgi:glucarate dehydratase
MAARARGAKQWRVGLTWGLHSNNHFDAPATPRTAAAAPGKITAIDTLDLAGRPAPHQRTFPSKAAGFAPETPGSRRTDMAGVEKANALYQGMGLGARNDAQAMQYLIPGWKFDNKRPCLVR